MRECKECGMSIESCNCCKGYPKPGISTRICEEISCQCSSHNQNIGRRGKVITS